MSLAEKSCSDFRPPFGVQGMTSGRSPLADEKQLPPPPDHSLGLCSSDHEDANRRSHRWHEPPALSLGPKTLTSIWAAQAQ